MSDHQWKILISAYADGELSPEDTARAERVLKEEPEARRYLAEIRGLSSLLRVDHDADTSPDLNNKVLKTLSKEENMKKSLNWKTGALALCVLLIVGTVALESYVKRGVQGRLKTATADIGSSVQLASTAQYEPYYMSKSSSLVEKARFSSKSEYADSSALAFEQIQAPPPMPMMEKEILQPGNTEEYNTVEENQFLEALRNPLSTFSIDVDTASYTNIRRVLTYNQVPLKDMVRIEEMINYFGYDYPQPEGNDPFSITTKAAICPWNPEHQLVLVGLKGKTLDAQQLPPSSLTFLIDVSGSMQSSEKLPLIRQAFTMMVRQLRPEDRVAIVVYASAEGVALDSTPGNNKEKILQAINNLQAGGSTAGGAGIRKAYEIAEKNFIKDGNNRVILATDGDFNVGVSSTSEMVRMIEEERGKGIFLTVIGVGSDGNLKDGRLSQIADKGNGSYHYFDSLQEAKKVFLTELGSTLFTIAKDVKIQVEFNPSVVKAYRLVGYEKRKLNAEDFNNDKKDAGELGAGHTVTALYEIIPAGSQETVSPVDELKYQQPAAAVPSSSGEMMTVKLRYKEPTEDTSKLITRVLHAREVSDQPTGDFAFAAAVAEFGMILRDSEWKGKAGISQVLEMSRASRGEDKFGYRAEFIKLVETAETLGVGQQSGGGMQFK